MDSPLITYHLEIGEDVKGPFVAPSFWLESEDRMAGHSTSLDFNNGEGEVVTGDMPDSEDIRAQERLDCVNLWR